MRNFLFICALGLLCGCKKPMTQPNAAELRHAENVQLFMTEVTNQISGIKNIISWSLDDSDAQYTNWLGTAQIDFVNHMGGIDRTNIRVRFSRFNDPTIPDMTNLFCHTDYDYELKSNLAKFHAQIEGSSK